MVTKFDQATLKNIRRELNEVLAKYAEAQGFEITIGGMKFSDNDFDAKLNCKIAGTKSFNDTILESVMKTHNISEFGIGNRKLVSYNSRSYKYPFVYEQNGQRFKCSAENAQKYFAKV